jgi:hypothetical protein
MTPQPTDEPAPLGNPAASVLRRAKGSAPTTPTSPTRKLWTAPDGRMLSAEAVRVTAVDKAGVQIRLGEVDPARVPTPAARHLALGVQGKLHWPLYLYGDPGAGKTFAALYALRRSTGLFLDALTWAKLRIDDGERAGSLLERMGPLPNSVRGTCTTSWS